MRADVWRALKGQSIAALWLRAEVNPPHRQGLYSFNSELLGALDSKRE